MNLDAIQSALRDQHLDGWLFYDHHHRDPIAYRILGLDPHSFVSRRWFYFVPADGEPRKLVHRIESGKLDTLPGTTRPPPPASTPPGRNSKKILLRSSRAPRRSPCNIRLATPSCTSRWLTPE